MNYRITNTSDTTTHLELPDGGAATLGPGASVVLPLVGVLRARQDAAGVVSLTIGNFTPPAPSGNSPPESADPPPARRGP